MILRLLDRAYIEWRCLELVPVPMYYGVCALEARLVSYELT